MIHDPTPPPTPTDVPSPDPIGRIGTQHRAPADRGPISRARRSVARIVALPADRLPGAGATMAAIGADELVALAAGFANPTALQRARRKLAAPVPRPLPRQWPNVTELVRRGNTLDADVHDAFFRIFRDDDHAARRHVGTILDGAIILQAELTHAPTTLAAAALARIAEGIALCFAVATGIVPPPLALPAPTAGLVTDADQAAQRWLRGHHIFLVITHGLVLALDQVADAATGDDRQRIVTALERFAALLDISADTICLTGDFHPAIYEGVIRVAMAPPYMPEGFSGVFSSDHRHLVRRLRELRPMFETLRDRLPAAHRDVVDSMTRLYDNHKQVCAHFVGIDRTSLLMQPASDETAIDQLEKFKWSRLRSLGVIRRG